MPVGGRGGQSPTPDLLAVGLNTLPVPAGVCSASPSFLWVFAVNTWERQQHLLPVSHQIELDTNRDGTVDYVVLNRDFSGPSTISDGRQLSWVLNVATGTLSAVFFAEHSTNTGNTVLLVCGQQIGMNAANLLTTQVNMSVIAQDFYFGGPGDLIEGLTVPPLGKRFDDEAADGPGKTTNASGLAVYDFGPFGGNSPERGLLLFTNGDRGAGNRGGATKDTEALLFLAPWRNDRVPHDSAAPAPAPPRPSAAEGLFVAPGSRPERQRAGAPGKGATAWPGGQSTHCPLRAA